MLVEKELLGAHVDEIERAEDNALMVTEVFMPEHNTGCKNFETNFQQEKNCFCVFLVLLLAIMKKIFLYIEIL